MADRDPRGMVHIDNGQPIVIASAERTPPDDTEGLRETLAEVVTQWALMYPLGNWGIWGTAGGTAREHLSAIADDIAASWGRDIADRIIGALAKLADPGDLPARMSAAMQAHYIPSNSSSCVCGTWSDGDPGICEGWDDHLAEAALAARWETAAQQAAENAELRHKLEHAEGQMSARRDHETRWEAEHRKRTEAEATIARVRRLCEMTIATSIRAQAIDQAVDTLAVLDGRGAPDGPESPDGGQ